MKRFLYRGFLGLALLACIAIGMIIAAMGRDSRNAVFERLYDNADRANRVIARVLHPQPEGPATERFVSIFAVLEGEVVDLPRAGRTGIGGGLTAIGDEALVLRFDGTLFSVSLDGTVSRPDIAVPENGFADYLLAIEKPEYSNFRHRPGRFRYNAIRYHDGPLGARLLISYLRWNTAEECYTATVSQLLLPTAPQSIADISAEAGDWEELFSTAPCLPLRGVMASIQGEEAGGRMVISPDGMSLYLSLGDFGWNGYHSDGLHPLSSVALAQYDEADHGKILEIDLVTGAARHLSKGHRNPQGITVDDAGRIWTVEHGPRGGDELNLIREGNNYGWPIQSLGTGYNSLPIPGVRNVGRHDEFVQPALAWLPSIATSAVHTIRGFHPTWDGDLLVGSLMGNRLVRIRIDGERVVFAEEIPMGRRLRDLTQISDEVIAIWTDSQEVIFLRAATEPSGAQVVEDHVAALDISPQQRTALSEAIEECASCHSFEANENRIGPSLATVGGAAVASQSFASYSAALRGTSGNWTRERLASYLADPQAVVPGTDMPELEFGDPAVPGLLADLLLELAGASEEP